MQLYFGDEYFFDILKYFSDQYMHILKKKLESYGILNVPEAGSGNTYGAFGV